MTAHIVLLNIDIIYLRLKSEYIKLVTVEQIQIINVINYKGS